jgi:hypothetical protein
MSATLLMLGMAALGGGLIAASRRNQVWREALWKDVFSQ